MPEIILAGGIVARAQSLSELLSFAMLVDSRLTAVILCVLSPWPMTP